MATIRDVAKVAHVSVGSVSRYLNGEKLKPLNQERVRTAIDQLKYKQNYIAKGLKNNRSMAIGVLINSLEDVFATSIVSSLESFVEEYGYSIILCDYQSDHQRMEKKIDFLMQRSIDGLVIFHAEQASPMLKQLNKLHIPIVAIDAPIEGVQADTVLVDNFEASRQAVLRLIQHGYQHVGIIAGQDNNYIGRERLDGYKVALKGQGLSIAEQNIWHGAYTVDDGFIGMQELLKNNSKLDAVFVINYYMTLGVIKALHQRQIRIGDEMGLIAFDHFAMNDIVTPSVTSISQPVAQMGKAAGAILVNRMTGDKDSKETETIICNSSLSVGKSDVKALA